MLGIKKLHEDFDEKVENIFAFVTENFSKIGK
jgi:hypothetical protein